MLNIFEIMNELDKNAGFETKVFFKEKIEYIVESLGPGVLIYIDHPKIHAAGIPVVANCAVLYSRESNAFQSKRTHIIIGDFSEIMCKAGITLNTYALRRIADEW
jgi:hypothetical protein